MAKSAKAKELEAKQKAAVKAERLRKKNSDDPRDWGRTRQMVEVYKRTAEVDPKLHLLVIGAAVATIAVIALIGVLTRSPWWAWVPLAIMAALLAAMLVLTNRAKKGAFVRQAGQPGSAQVALSMLNEKKYASQIGIAATRQLDLVHRVLGPGGIVLVGEGNPARTRQLLPTEPKKHEQVAYGVQVTPIMMGDGQGQVPLTGLQKHIEKLPKVLQAHQIAEVKQRLRALDAVRPKAPLPKGPMPTIKGVNRAMRGR